MPIFDRHLLVPTSATEAPRTTLPSVQTSPRDPAWLHPPDARDTHWDWLDTASPPGGLEITEHAVPEGWFVRTFGVTSGRG